MNRYKWGHSRRFNDYPNYFRRLFGQRIQKLSINAGFTCPNRDGTAGHGGCTYCNNDAFSPPYCRPKYSMDYQIRQGIDFLQKRYKADKFLAYFQNYSNTYASLDKLKGIYNQALRYPEIVGLVIGTRPDVIDDEKLAYFQELSGEKYVILEYGIESCYNTTLGHINRGHSFEQSKEAIERTASFGIKTGAHIMFGLPGETRRMMLDEAEILNELPLNNIKFHQLQIMKDTVMGKEYLQNPDKFRLFEVDEYIEFIIDFTERLNPDFVIERFSGEAPSQYVLAPDWGIRSHEVMSRIEKRMRERNTWQGRLFEG
ncbi:MAG: TIGR01212 family radical SAM protein [Bacteroidales bacterium]|nr:TIGR01212 family radical SAM protein [Bacteroidales bacterium]MCF8337016.1 TIGR01212 family radical SAM protein [Bacteroidales bacterium]